MASRLPPLNPLRAFEATARNGSLTKAAGELNVTHGAISHQIRALEAWMKVRLFGRAGQRVKLTPHGAELLPAVSSAFEGIAAATARMTRPTSAGTLSVSCVPALLSLWLLPRLSSFTAQYPEIRLTLTGSNDPANRHSRDFDLSILYGDGNWPDCWLKQWSTLSLFPVVSPSLINNRPIRAVRDLADHVILHADDGREWHTWLAAADALELESGRQHRLNGAQLAIEAAIHGHGVALGDTVTVSGLLARGQLVTPFNLAVPAVDDYYIVCRKNMRSAPVASVFIDWLFAEREAIATRIEQQPAGQVAVRKRRTKAAAGG